MRHASNGGFSGLIELKHGDAFFTTKLPLFGATETQKRVIEWASWHNLPPIMSVQHGKPTSPDKKSFTDPNEFHRTYYPYAMAVAMVEYLGDPAPREVKVYFCDVELHEENYYAHIHSRSNGSFIVSAV